MRIPPYLALMAGAVAPGLTTACNRDRKLATRDPESAGRVAAVVPDTASDPGAQVARRIVKAATLQEAVSGTREALTRGGIAISNLGGTTQPAAGPPSPFIVLPPEAVLLAFEARQRATHSRLTLDQLGAMLADLGWPFTGEGMPGDQLMRIVGSWVRAARNAPNDPLNFTPLFLGDMGRRQVPPVDLASDSTDPGEVRLGFLEVQLFAAALTRGLGTPVKTSRLEGVPVVTAAYGASVAGPCDDAKDWFSKTLAGGAVGAYGGWGVGQALEKSLGGSGLSAASVGALTKALDAVATGMKILKLSELYGSTQIDLDYASEVPAHRPAPGEDKFASVVARAGVDAQQYEEYKQSLKSSDLAASVRNCLETLGLPTWDDLAEVASDAESWRVRWVLGKGSPKHALHILDRNDWYHPGNRVMSLKRTSETSAEAKYTFKLTPETESGHPGNQLKGEVQVTAELQTAKPPGVGTITDAMLGPMGLIKSLIELGLGWLQTMVTPEADLMVPIVYHEPGINILIEDENQVVMDFKGSKRIFGIYGIKGAERSRHVYAGSIHLGEDSLWHGQVLLTASGTYTIGDSIAIAARALEANPGEDPSFEDAVRAFAKTAELMADVPTCNGSYDGAQIFAVEGSFTTGDKGQQQVELAFLPAGPPEFYNSTSRCRMEGEEIEGVKVIPNRIVKGQETAVVIDAPKAGEQRVYRKNVKALGIYGSTVITVGAKF